MTKTIGVVGIDGCGKSSVIRRFTELSPTARGSVAAMTCPTYHQTPNAPLAVLSQQLDALSKAGDALGSFELKGVALYLQMTLYGPVERFMAETWEPLFLLSEHHALVDSLAYGAFYSQRMKKPLEAQRLEPAVRERLALDPILEWHAHEGRRLGEAVDFWALPPHIGRIFAQPRAALVDDLARRYRSRLPDALLILDVPPEVAMARLAARGDAQAELHEQSGILALLRQSYRELGNWLAREHPECTTRVIDTTAAGGVDQTLREVLAVTMK
jgi:thymidylate kinase